MSDLMFDEEEVRKAIRVLKPNNQLFEIRFIGGASGRLNFSGYFSDADTLIAKLKSLRPTANGNVYITLNEIKTSCYSREQRNWFVQSCKTTTSDNDIEGYNWLMLDFDPTRPSGVSSSNEELELAHKMAQNCYKYLTAKRWAKPIIAMSGNGYHLLYKVYIDNDESGKAKSLISKVLNTLDVIFSDGNVKVDVSVFNPSRICKLYGTMACKGANTDERPHRMARLLYVPETIEEVSVAQLEDLTGEYPEEEKPQEYNNYNPKEFNLERWMSDHGVEWTEKNELADGGVKYILKQCPFNPEHNHKDACVIKLKNGALAFKCFHDSCANNHWPEFRRIYEPDAYSKMSKYKPKEITLDKKMYREVKGVVEGEELPPELLSPLEIFNEDTSDEEWIETGIREIDKKMRGLKKGFVTCLSGLRACGKSSLLSQITLNTIQRGYKVAMYSGELTPRNTIKWMVQQAAGRWNVNKTSYENYFYVEEEYGRQICEWLEGKFFLYNNDIGNNYALLEDVLERSVQNQGADIIVLDNLMTVDITDLDYDFFQRQSKFVESLELFAKRNNVHVIFVAHPRKAQGFLRLEDVSGTNDIVNRVDNAFIMHRVNEDFKRKTKETLHWRDDNRLYEASNVLEICKDRDGGIQDYFIPLYFEIETKRLKNEPVEAVQYGWESGLEQDDDLPF